MGRINSREKGKIGERQFRDVLREAGFRARRGQQYAGNPDAPDVVCPDLPHIQWEVKRVQALNIHQAMAKAILDAGGKMPVIAHRKNNTDWLCTLRAADLLDLLKETSRVRSRSDQVEPTFPDYP
jgi:Holliday junction resolvase